MSKEALVFPIDSMTERLSIGDDFSVLNDCSETIYYASDIHLEYQLNLIGASDSEVKELIREKIQELVFSIPKKAKYLLIGGDVANSAALEKIFYEELSLFVYPGEIIGVLGNHELWDCDVSSQEISQSADEVIRKYKKLIAPSRFGKVSLLENELLLIHKGQEKVILDEAQIVKMECASLSKLCADSTFILLGGVGFSGLDSMHNANSGLYRNTISFEEDVRRSSRFRRMYEKVLECASDFPVVILTHTPFRNWHDGATNPNWIYVSGHTHQNVMTYGIGNAAMLADNQFGYEPRPFFFKNFPIKKRIYDSLAKLPNGIHKISRDQYIEFNYYRGIVVRGVKHPGDIYALKREGIYMFVLQSPTSLCLLQGGSRRKLNKDIEYYYDNLIQYVQLVRGSFASYCRVIRAISKEVQAFGGSGLVHGCIVDIDWHNHIYLNPLNGEVVPYYAPHKGFQIVYEDIEELLEHSPCPPRFLNGKLMLEKYSAASLEGDIFIISNKNPEIKKMAILPRVVLDSAMYEPSRIMRSIQYVLDYNVVRIWNDRVLDTASNIDVTKQSGISRKYLS